MFKIFGQIVTTGLCVLTVSTFGLAKLSFAAESVEDEAAVDKAVPHQQALPEQNQAPLELQKALVKIIPNMPPTSISRTIFPDLYEVTYGVSVFYIDATGRYLFKGEILDINTDTNLTEETQNRFRQPILEAADEKEMIIFPAKDEKFKVTVFTDVDCFYCVKLHKEIKQYNDAGITVRYMAFPRSGLTQGTTYQRMVDVWCSDDRQEALTLSKNGMPVDKNTCMSPVAGHYQLGRMIGVQGTPAVFSEDGAQLGGYLSATMLRAELERRQKKELSSLAPAK